MPLLGHILGILKHGAGYYAKIAKECNLPIFTLSVPRGKIYIVTSPNLVMACDKRAKIISFAPFIVEFSKRILSASQHGVDLLSEDLLEQNGATTLRPETIKTMHQLLMPGDTLNEMTEEVLQQLLAYLESSDGIGEGKNVSLFQWFRQFISVASTNAIYGSEKNPMGDLDVMNGFWSVDRNLALLGLNIFPRLLTPEGSRSRDLFFDVFRKYYATGGLETASHLIKARYHVCNKYGVSDDEIARYDLAVCTALLVNTVPAACWTLYHVFSNSELLDEVRRGIENEVFPQGQSRTLGIVKIREIMTAFPLLESLVKEVLRVRSSTASARFVLEDIVISDSNGRSYLLKKDSSLMMPSVPIHSSEAIWGETVESFDPSRFLKQEQHQRVPASAYRTFGGGNAICPGRHLATHEIISILVVMVLRYDIEPRDKEWKTLRTRSHISTSISTPVDDIWVEIMPREEMRDVKWSITWR